MGNLFKLAIFLTSFLPLWITILFIEFVSICQKVDSGNIVIECMMIAFIILILVFSLLCVKRTLNKSHPSQFRPYIILDAKLESGISTEFLLSYILPLIAFDFTSWEEIIQFLFFYLILTFLCVRNNNVYANLWLELKGYRFYSCQLLWEAAQETNSVEGMVLSKVNLVSQKNTSVELRTLNKPFYITDLEE
ncbi:hypothetical protein [Turicibacter sanguinis]|uniref:Uncharacterized protein n=2 Tax=Turicibacter sanguinis TaxID=154288 RepID=A0A6G2CQQ6_9FIRM|nr:hypothetical protein [Turicibacter sanguinis]KAB3587132.1 hypothetical protein GAY13_23605 [Phocaeicola vulgatus]EFF65134.1 hypothetical protein CUW_0553 [Turicibacter sanguinis PC909]MTK22761.1 hypothetical protein [Turicibacter sanguinis]MTK70458.1 hypothetical protein [Turicibacter sanguinis]MTK73978.1 hypothetical protein [Turicibacter sanguinis]